MNKKSVISLISFIAILALFGVFAFAVPAAPTASTVLVNGKNVAFDAYQIDGSNYFKLRDLAYTLNGTEKQFSVGWDEAANAISLVRNEPYVAVGGEMTGKGGGEATAAPTDSKILLNGFNAQFTAYNIGGNNYFKLRDIGAAINFGVDWDEENNTIAIDTSKDYVQEGAASDGIVGAWRFEGEGVVEFFLFNADGTFEIVTFDKEGGPTELFSGDYVFSNDEVSMSNVIINGVSAGDVAIPFELNGDTALISGFSYERVPVGIVFEVLSDPLAPYPPR